MDVTSGCAGSSENVARQTRAVSSCQATVTESSLRTTLIGPGRTPVRSSGTDTAGVCERDEDQSRDERVAHVHSGADYRSTSRSAFSLTCVASIVMELR